MLAVLAFVVLARPAPITITIRGAAVSEAVRQIGIASGLTLRTRAPIQNQMVLVHVQDTPVEALLEHLAEAVHGEWLEDGEARVLTRSAKLQTAMVKAQRDRQAKPLNDHLQALVRSQRPWTEDHGRELAKQILQAQARTNANQDPAADDNLSRLHDQLPFQAALVQLLAKIGAERFAGLGPVERIVFSNKPNARQHRLPDGCDAVLRSLSANVRMFEQEVARQGGGVIGYSGGPSRAFESDARVTLAIHNDRASLRISAEPYSTSLWFGAYYSQPPQNVRYPQIPIALSPNAKWIAEWWQSRTGLTEPPAPWGAIRPYLLAPADSPRIGTLVYEVLDALGVYDRRQWVAWIPLFAQLHLEMGLQSQPTLNQAASTLQANECELIREGEWLVVRHSQPTLVEWLEKPREPLQRFVRHVEETKAVRFMDVAELIAEVGQTGVPFEVGMLGYPMMSVPISPLISLIGSMSPAQRSAAASVSGIGLGQLAPGQVALAEQALYEQGEWPIAPYEVTDAFPSGIPRDTVFQLQVERRDVAQPWIPSTPRARIRVLEIGQLVAQIANRQQGRSQGYPGDMADQYLYGSQSVFHLRLVFRGGRSIETEAQEPPVLATKPMPWQEFPEPFRSEIEKRLKGRGGNR